MILDQELELHRRMTLAREHPELLEPWDGTIEALSEELVAYCAQKAEDRSHAGRAWGQLWNWRRPFQ